MIMTENSKRHINPWAWVPSLYFAEGLPYVAVMTIAVILYKKMGISNTDIALYTGWLYLPWVIKPFWSPMVDLVRTKRWWIVTMQAGIAIAFAGIAFFIPAQFFFRLTLAFFWLVAFTSATHDIAADGFYMHGLDSHEQSFFVGIRSTFYRISTIAGQGLLVIIAGLIEDHTGKIPLSWTVVFAILSILFFLASLYHAWALPRPASDRHAPDRTVGGILRESLLTFRSFFMKKNIVPALLFMLLFRLPEAQLVKIINPFLLDPIAKGGLGLSTSTVGIVYGTVGIIGLTLGGILGGIAASQGGTETLALADGLRHHPPRPRLCLSRLRPGQRAMDRQHLRLHRAVWLRIWLHGLHALPHLFLGGRTQHVPLRHQHGLHGPGNDAAGHDGRMAAGTHRLPPLLPLDDPLLRGNVCRLPLHQDRP